MVLVYLKSGECIEVESAIKAEVRNATLVCMDDRDEVVSSFPTVDVEAYSANPTIVTVLEEEICEELTTIPAEPGLERPFPL